MFGNHTPAPCPPSLDLTSQNLHHLGLQNAGWNGLFGSVLRKTRMERGFRDIHRLTPLLGKALNDAILLMSLERRYR
jgi:hypothetical protein